MYEHFVALFQRKYDFYDFNRSYYKRWPTGRAENIGAYGRYGIAFRRRSAIYVSYIAFDENRFGSTSEIGIYEMLQSGLRQVSNPSELLLSNHGQDLSGIAVSATVEGVRPILLEVQALVSTAAYGVPQRSATGFDSRRLNMLLAVLEKGSVSVWLRRMSF